MGLFKFSFNKKTNKLCVAFAHLYHEDNLIKCQIAKNMLFLSN